MLWITIFVFLAHPNSQKFLTDFLKSLWLQWTVFCQCNTLECLTKWVKVKVWVQVIKDRWPDSPGTKDCWGGSQDIEEKLTIWKIKFLVRFLLKIYMIKNNRIFQFTDIIISMNSDVVLKIITSDIMIVIFIFIKIIFNYLKLHDWLRKNKLINLGITNWEVLHSGGWPLFNLFNKKQNG